MKELNIDCMKYRKSTHLAGIDVEAIIADKGKCLLTIKECYYDRGVDVSGNKTDGYFLKFEEPVKEMVVNSTNRKVISEIVKNKNNCTAVESRNISNWKGVELSLLFDENVKMMGKVVGGIRIDRSYISTPKKTLEAVKLEFKNVNSRDSFVQAMTENKDFMSNSEIIEQCKKLAESYPAPKKND